MTKEAKEHLMELINCYGEEYRRTHDIERMADMSTEQIHAEYEYVFSILRSRRKLHMLPRCYGDTYTRLEECKALLWEEFYSTRFRNAMHRLYSDRVGIDTEDEDEENWEERRVRHPIIWPQSEW